MFAHALRVRMENAMQYLHLPWVALSFAALSLDAASHVASVMWHSTGVPSEKEQGIDVLPESDGIRRATGLGSGGSVRQNRSANSMFNPTLIVIEAFIRELRTMYERTYG